MAGERSSLTRSEEWRALAAQYQRLRGAHLRDLFAADPARGRRFALEAAGLYLDYAKNLIDDETIRLLSRLAEQAGLRMRIEAAFGGRGAAAAGTASTGGSIVIVDHDGTRPVETRMAEFAERVRNGAWTGFSGKRIRNVVNIAAGGMDLGPAMACEALKVYSDRALAFRFVSNGDAGDFAEATRDLDPAETLFIVCSRSFATYETLTNARWAKEWLFRAVPGPAPLTPEQDPLGDGPTEIDLLFAAQDRAMAAHFAYVSANLENVARFGGYVPYDPNNYFGRPAQVRNLFELNGATEGRHPLDSAAALSTMIAIGPAHFQRMLAGFQAMDEHFRGAPFDRNMPVLLALIGIWYTAFHGAETRAVLPYDHYLSKLGPYLQYLEMARNGTAVDVDGHAAKYQAASIVWGSPGTSAQHAFFAYLHRGAKLVPCDFIGFCQAVTPLPRNPSYPAGDRDVAMANMLAQIETLAFGKTAVEAAAEGIPAHEIPARVLQGNQPSNTILARRLTPETLGALIALYEHRAFVQRVILRLDADAAEVEMPGAALARRLISELETGRVTETPHDSSTSALIAWYYAHREGGDAT